MWLQVAHTMARADGLTLLRREIVAIKVTTRIDLARRIYEAGEEWRKASHWIGRIVRPNGGARSYVLRVEDSGSPAATQVG